MYVYMYVCLQVCIYVWMHASVYIYVMYVCMYVCLHACLYVYVMCVCMYVCMYVYIYYICRYVYVIFPFPTGLFGLREPLESSYRGRTDLPLPTPSVDYPRLTNSSVTHVLQDETPARALSNLSYNN